MVALPKMIIDLKGSGYVRSQITGQINLLLNLKHVLEERLRKYNNEPEYNDRKLNVQSINAEIKNINDLCKDLEKIIQLQ